VPERRAREHDERVGREQEHRDGDDRERAEELPRMTSLSFTGIVMRSSIVPTRFSSRASAS